MSKWQCYWSTVGKNDISRINDRSVGDRVVNVTDWIGLFTASWQPPTKSQNTKSKNWANVTEWLVWFDDVWRSVIGIAYSSGCRLLCFVFCICLLTCIWYIRNTNQLSWAINYSSGWVDPISWENLMDRNGCFGDRWHDNSLQFTTICCQMEKWLKNDEKKSFW